MEKMLSSAKADVTLGLVTPSAPLPALFPDRFERGVSSLVNLGFNVKRGAYVSTRDGAVAACAQKRAEDINSLFLDPDVSLLMATIGGDYAAEILPYLDWDTIRSNKKGLIGYSDITVLLHAIGLKSQQVVFYGPTLMTEFAEYPKPPRLSAEAFMELFGPGDKLVISPVDSLLAKGSDWALPPQERVKTCPVFQKTIRAGSADGVVLGGCMEALERLRGTEYWPSFKDAILAIETVDDEFDEKKWRSFIADYTNMGILKAIRGMVIGQKMWSKDDVDCLSSMLLDATASANIPILYGLPFGHISPIATLPLYTRAALDADAMKLIYEKPFKYDYLAG